MDFILLAILLETIKHIDSPWRLGSNNQIELDNEKLVIWTNVFCIAVKNDNHE